MSDEFGMMIVDSVCSADFMDCVSIVGWAVPTDKTERSDTTSPFGGHSPPYDGTSALTLSRSHHPLTQHQ